MPEQNQGTHKDQHGENDKNDHVVIAFFEDGRAAERAIADLKGWDHEQRAIQLGIIGRIEKKGDKIKTHTDGRGAKGSAAGATVGIIAGALSGGLTLVGGVLVGGALGGITGKSLDRSLSLTAQEIEAIGQELDAGQVAVVVACDEYEVDATSMQLKFSGGTIRHYVIPAEALAAAAAELDNDENAGDEQQA